MRIILASGSPRRRELLAQAGYQFEIEVSDADENISAASPQELVEELALRKAMAAAGRREEDLDRGIIIGADTVVILDGEIMGKPKDEEDAARMLCELSGRDHQVCTGVALLGVQGGTVSHKTIFHESTDVAMCAMSRRDILDYIATGEPMDKAGAYGIQGKAAVFVSGIRGDYYNVVGLPLCRLNREIRRMIREMSEETEEVPR